MHPFISIITVNYNGKKYLGDYLDSLNSLNYPQDKYEVIVVDNASTDGSVKYIKNNYPDVEVIKSKKNLGFGGGNNLGIKFSQGELIVLLNNDTVVHNDFLKKLVDCYKKLDEKEKVGAINAKLVLFDKYIPITLKGASLVKADIPKAVQAKNTHVFTIINDKREYLENLYIPYNYKLNNEKLIINLYIQNSGRKSYEILLDNKIIEKGEFNIKEEPKTVKLEMSKRQLEKESKDLIQNSGTILFKKGYGRDRGAVVIEGKQYYEADEWQYDKEEEIPAFCGAGVLLNREALNEVGYFDDDFFMYYEDCELSLRLKNSGWKVYYCPDAMVRHIHSASSKEWSDFFIYQVERSRLLFVAKQWPRIMALRELTEFIFRNTFGSLAYYFLGSQSSREYLNRFKIRLKVVLSVIFPFIVSLSREPRLNEKQVNKFI